MKHLTKGLMKRWTNRFVSLLLVVIMVCSGLTPMAVQAEESTGTEVKHSFADVPDSQWYCEYVQYVWENGIFDGITDTTFEPDSTMTRAMFVTVLGRMSGVNEADYTEKVFSDVGVNTWYGPYVAWAVEQKITDGVDDDRFDPDASVTRQDIATFVQRYLTIIGYEIEADELTYADAGDIYGYAVEPIGVCQNIGLMDGYPDNTFRPRNYIIRAEAAAICTRLDQYMDEHPEITRYYSVDFEYPDTMTEEDIAATELPEDQTVKSGELVYSLPLPYREGYIFTGWYYDSDLALLAATDDTITENTMLYPRLVASEEANPGDGCLNYVAAIDVGTDYRVTVQAPSAEAVKEGISFMDVTGGNLIEDFTVVDNNDGTYTIEPVNGLKEGNTYQLYTVDREENIAADGEVISDSEYVLFIHEGEVQRKEICYYNIFTYREEVSRLKLDDDVKFVDFDSISGFDMDAALGLYSVSVTAEGDTTMVENDVTGTFTYDGNDLSVGDIIAIHNGAVDTEEKRVTDGDVAYVEITEINGNTYSYRSANATEVMFLPDVIPVPISEDQDMDDNTITVANELLDFSEFENPEVLNNLTTVDVDDFVALYEGELGTATEAEYGRITKVEKGEETTTITYVLVTLDELKQSLSTYEVNGVDIVLPEEEIESLENEILAQAEESGFAEQAAQYAVQNALGIQEEVQWNTSYNMTPEQANLFGVDIEAGSITYMLKIDPPNIKADITTSLKKVTQVNKATGLRVNFGVTIPVGIEVVENGNRVLESYNLDLYVTFEQEVAFATKFSADVQWDNFLYIVWWIDEVVVDATFEMGVYTGVGVVVSVYSEKWQDKSYIWDELVENKGNETFSSAQSISQKLNSMMSNGNKSFFSSEDGNSLAEEYSNMLAREIDYVDILALKLYHAKGYFDPETCLVNYVLDVELVFGAKLNVTAGISFENLNVKQYSFHMKMFDKTGSANVVDKQTPYTNFNFFIMGNLGLRAGVRVTMSVGLISVKLDNLGAMAEVGAYLDIYGFFYYHYDWNGATKKTNTKSGGAIYLVVGIYMDLDLFGGVFFDLASFNLHLFEKEWPIFSAGSETYVYGFNYEGKDKAIEIYVPENRRSEDFSKYFDIKVLDRSYFDMGVMNLSDGEISTKNYYDYLDRYFDIQFTNSAFRYDSKNHTVDMYPKSYTAIEEGEMVITWKGSKAAFSSEPIQVRIPIKWVDTGRKNVIYFDSNGGTEVEPLRAPGGLPLDKNLIPENPTKEGYEFCCWYEYESFGQDPHNTQYTFPDIMPTSSYIRLDAHWIAKNDTPYTVEHYVETLEDGEYELYKTEKFTGKTDGAIRFEHALDLEGFSINKNKFPQMDFPVFSSSTGEVMFFQGCGWYYINGDGSTVIRYYYDRNVYYFCASAYNRDAGVTRNYQTSGWLKYGEEIDLPEYSSTGWTFEGWSEDGKTIIDVSTMPARKLNLTAVWTAQTDIPYTVNHYVMDTNGEYQLYETEKLEGRTAEKLTMSDLAKDYDYVTYLCAYNGSKVVQEVSVQGNGSTTVDLYYKRDYHYVYWGNSRAKKVYDGAVLTPPDAPEKAGYTFTGWDGYTEGMVMDGSNLTFTPLYTVNHDTPYTVVHIKENLYGKYVANSSYAETENLTGTTDTAVTPAVREYEGFDSPAAQEVTIKGDGTTTVTYKYGRKSYGVTLDPAGGTIVNGYDITSYKYGVEFSLPTTRISRAGYTLLGWYDASDETKTLITEATNVYDMKDLSFVAVWEANSANYTILHYVENTDGSYSVQQTETKTAKVDETVEAQTVDFTGFVYDPAAEGSVLSGEVAADGTLTLKIYYNRIPVEVTWYDYDNTTVLGTTTVKYGCEITAPADSVLSSVPTKTGYTFAGWKSDLGTIGLNAVSRSALDYGTWTANSYSVIFDGNGADGGSMNAQSFTYDQQQALSRNAYTYTGKTFIGWSTEATGDVIYTDGEEVINLTGAKDGSVTLYAVWTTGPSANYTVEYYTENLDGSYQLESSDGTFSGVIDLEATAKPITIHGFTFDEDNENNVISGIVAEDGSTVFKLYYTRSSYTLTVDFGGEQIKVALTDLDRRGYSYPVGEKEIADEVYTVVYGTNISEYLADDLTETGYTFAGWFDADGNEYTADSTMPYEDITITAKWTPVTIKVTFHPGAYYFNPVGDEVTIEYPYGSEIEEYLGFTCNGYVAAGWSFGEMQGNTPYATIWPFALVNDCHSEYPSFTETGEVTLCPFWSNEYTTVIYNGNGGTGNMNNMYIDIYGGARALTKNNFTREGYTFIGWSTSAEHVEGTDTWYDDYGLISGEKNEVINLYAQWEKNS